MKIYFYAKNRKKIVHDNYFTRHRERFYSIIFNSAPGGFRNLSG